MDIHIPLEDSEVIKCALIAVFILRSSPDIFIYQCISAMVLLFLKRSSQLLYFTH